MKQTSAWFEDWFASPYYPVLYAHRDSVEAEFFLDQLIRILQPKPEARFWDLACGSGRHSIYLNTCGFDVTGTDLSEPFIHTARLSENSGLRFFRQDMRDVPPGKNFDFVLNLFTAFGYFDREEDDLLVLKRVYEGLKPGGIFVLDYLNVVSSIENLIPLETKTIDNVHFSLKRFAEKQRIIKEIEVRDGQESHHYLESIKILYLEDFRRMLNQTGFEIMETWGNYQAEPFDREKSPRLILIAQKHSL